MKKKMYILTLVLSMLFLSIFITDVYATETNGLNSELYTVNPEDLIENQKKIVENKEKIEAILKTMPDTPNFLATPNVSADLENAIVSGVRNRATYIDVSSYNLNLDTFDHYAFSYILNDYPELFYCNGFYTNYDMETNKIYTVSPVYIYDEATTAQYTEVLEYYRDEMLSGVDSDMNDVEKLMVAHDFIIKNTEYDYERLNSDTLIQEDFTVIGVLNGEAVCQGYTVMLKYLLDAMNIESTYVYSINMNHIWNAVKIDGKYYHVDSTWTDPGTYSIAEVYRTYFLKGNDYFLNNAGHYDWETAIADSDFGTAYDNYFWNNYTRFFVYANDYWYYMTGTNTLQKINLRNNASSETITVTDLDKYTTTYYLGSNGKNIIYCMDASNVYALNLDTLSFSKYFTPTFDTSEQYLGAITSISPTILAYRYEDDNYYWIEYYENKPLEGIELGVDTIDLNVGQTYTLNPKLIPENTTESSLQITWATSNKNVATVAEGGVITAVGEGTATITVTINGFKDTCTVNVSEVEAIIGDIDLNGKVAIKDARYLVEYVLGDRELTEQQLAVADVDGDGRILIKDARKIVSMVLGN